MLPPTMSVGADGCVTSGVSLKRMTLGGSVWDVVIVSRSASTSSNTGTALLAGREQVAGNVPVSVLTRVVRLGLLTRTPAATVLPHWPVPVLTWQMLPVESAGFSSSTRGALLSATISSVKLWLALSAVVSVASTSSAV